MTAAASTLYLEARRDRFRFALPAAIVVAGGCAAVVVTGDVLLRPGWFAAFSAYNVLAFTGAAVLWLRMRPSSRVGLLLLALAAGTAVQSLQGSSSSLALSVGVLADPIVIVLWVYLLLTFPTHRLSRPGAATLAIALVTIAVGFVPWFFFSSHVAGGTPLARCTAACPPNALMIADRPGVASHFGDAEELGRALFAAACFLLLGVRLLVATRPRRRILAPIYAVGLVWVAAFGAYGVAANLLVTDRRVWDTIGWTLTGARMAIPLAFALAIVAARSFAGRALTTMIAQLPDRPTAAELQRVTSNALGDAGLQLAFRHGESGGWVDSNGARIGPPAPASGRAWREVRARNGDFGAALAYEEFLEGDQEFLDAATAAVKLSLNSIRLESELRMSHAELRDSERRSVAIVDEQRRRVGRDLHDSAQQRLVVIGMDLERLRAGLHAGLDPAAVVDAELERLGGELGLAVDEIRDVSHKNFPQVLSDLGLRAALTEAVRGNTRATLRLSPLERYSSDVEAAVYFPTLEAIQNAVKHGTPTTRVTASVWARAREVCFEVRDDGPGFDPKTVPPDGGLAGLSHRLGAVGGTLEINSVPGKGTVIAGRVPTG